MKTKEKQRLLVEANWNPDWVLQSVSRCEKIYRCWCWSTFCSLNVSDDLNGLLRGLSAKESACSAGDAGSVPGSGRSLSKEMGHSDWHRVIFHCTFDLHLISDAEHFFMCFFWPSLYLWRNVYLVLLSIFLIRLPFFFFLYWATRAACMFWRLIPCWLLHL